MQSIWSPGVIFKSRYMLNFFRGNKNRYLHFMSFFHIDMTQVVEIFPQVRQELTYFTQSISWVLMYWRRIINVMVSQITSISTVCLTACSGADIREHESSASLALNVGNPPVIGRFPSQRASNAESVPVWFRHHDAVVKIGTCYV